MNTCQHIINKLFSTRKWILWWCASAALIDRSFSIMSSQHHPEIIQKIDILLLCDRQTHVVPTGVALKSVAPQLPQTQSELTAATSTKSRYFWSLLCWRNSTTFSEEHGNIGSVSVSSLCCSFWTTHHFWGCNCYHKAADLVKKAVQALQLLQSIGIERALTGEWSSWTHAWKQHKHSTLTSISMTRRSRDMKNRQSEKPASEKPAIWKTGNLKNRQSDNLLLH